MATQPSSNSNPVADADQTLRAMTKQPDQALRHAQQFFGTATPDQRAQQGVQVLYRMLDNARYLEGSHPIRAFTTALRVQSLAKAHLPDGATRTTLRDRSFEAAGRIAHLTAGSGKPALAARMLQRADNDAGAIYRGALMRGIQQAETPDVSLRASHAQNARDAETIRQLQEALARKPAAPAAVNSNITPPGTIGSGAQNIDPPTATRSRLNNVESTAKAPKRPGLVRRLGGRIVQVAKYGAVAYGAVLLAQSASVHVLGNPESSFLGTTVTTPKHYDALRFNSGAGIPGTIGMPKVSVNTDPAALEAARKIGAREEAERQQTQRNRMEATPRSGASLPDVQALTGDMNKFRIAHPDAFKEITDLARQDVNASVEKLREYDPDLGKRMNQQLVVNGVQGYREPLQAAESKGVQEQAQRIRAQRLQQQPK